MTVDCDMNEAASREFVALASAVASQTQRHLKLHKYFSIWLQYIVWDKKELEIIILTFFVGSLSSPSTMFRQMQ